MSEHEQHYDDAFSAFLEEIWGEGYMSPGGAAEVARVLEGLDLSGMTVLDIGCGTGAITLSLVQDHGAAKSIGIDVEAVVCEKARERAAQAGAADRVEIVEVAPGPLPFEDAHFDLVFSKDSIIHIEDKEALAREVYQILKPGGVFAASDWLSSHDDPPTPEMQRYLDLEGLGFTMASAARWENALTAAGFADVATKDRNPWYREVAEEELETLSGARRKEFEEKCGKELVAQNVAVWEAMVHVLNTGELRPHHLRARKPA